MVPVPLAVKAEMRMRGSGKPDYRHRARTGRGDKEVVIDRWEWPITENRGHLGKVKAAVTLKCGIRTGISLSGEEIFSQS